VEARIDRSSGDTATVDRPSNAPGGAGTDILSSGERLALRMRYAPATSSCPIGEMPLAAIHFGAEPFSSSGPTPAAQVSMSQPGGAPRMELWTSELPVQYGQVDGLRYGKNGQVLFGVVSEPVEVASAQFEVRVRAIYDALFALIEAQGYPHLLRVWNYFPAINGAHEQLENYQRFCRARAAAFQDRFRDFIPRLPSASAVGTHGGSLVVYFIAAREPGQHRENPRQLSAYTYPLQYGPRSPSFARATLKRFGGREMFFISGTASIVGHESMHRGDVRAQLDETLRNIEALIETTGRDEATQFRGLADIGHMKVYLRRPSDLPLVRELLERRVGVGAEALFLHGDVCRGELLVEIEAIVGR
jgi:chorismate lyase/3-hydroxybenzoate synthase